MEGVDHVILEKLTSVDLVGVAVHKVANRILQNVDHRVNGYVNSQRPNPGSGNVLDAQ